MNADGPYDCLITLPADDTAANDDRITDALDVIDRFEMFGGPGEIDAFIGDLRRILGGGR